MHAMMTAREAAALHACCCRAKVPSWSYSECRLQAALRRGISKPTLMLYADSDTALGQNLLKVRKLHWPGHCCPAVAHDWHRCPCNIKFGSGP